MKKNATSPQVREKQKKSNNNVLLYITALTLALVMVGSGVNANAQTKTKRTNSLHKINAEQHQAIHNAIENHDYQAWLEAVGDHPHLTEVVNEQNFELFAQMHSHIEAGEFEEAKTIAEELGLPQPPHSFEKRTKHGMVKKARAAVHEAIQNNDYEAWKAAIGDRGPFTEFGQTEFDLLVEAHDLKEAGDHEGAKDIMDELGLHFKGPRANGFGKPL